MIIVCAATRHALTRGLEFYNNHLATGLRSAGPGGNGDQPRLSGQQAVVRTDHDQDQSNKEDDPNYPILTDGRKADVFINDRPAGAIQFYQGTTWTYDHHGLAWWEPNWTGHSAPQQASLGFMECRTP